MPRYGTRKCLNCHCFFKPDPRTQGKQKYCLNPDCRKAGKAARQKKWLSKRQNRDYFKGSANVHRVRCWRAKNPGYWKNAKKSSGNNTALQDGLMAQDNDIINKNNDLNQHALQDALASQPSVLIGLIAHLTGSALQDDIVNSTLKLQQLGEDFLHPVNQNKGENNELQNLAQPGTLPGNTGSVQLGRSPPGT
jgi:hypothetical protein